MKYCEKCNSIVTLDYCPTCGNKKIREISPDDFCFLVECGQVYGDILKDTFLEEGIECALIPWGDGVRSKFAMKLENYKVYVPFKYYDRARAILDENSDVVTTNIKELLLTNRDKWHVADERTEKNIRKRLKIADGVDIFEFIREGVEQSQDVKNRGVMYSFTSGANWLTVKIGSVTLWFSDDSFEIRL